ncbi:MAG TPA: MASE1 domain-containing protein, partial [Actinoplanes sp.]|nr:MASE1 domain-containing protein [Actinoplanes sp.]
METQKSIRRTITFATLFVAAVFAGRQTVIEGTQAAAVWPAAGVAVVWFSAQRHSRLWGLDAALFVAATAVLNWATGATVAISAVFVVANCAQVATFIYLLGRWRPRLWGAGGTEGLQGPKDLWGLLGAAFLSTCAGAAIGPTGVWLMTGSYSAPSTLMWLARNTASVLLIGAVGLCVGNAFAEYASRTGSTKGWSRYLIRRLRGISPRRLFEYTALASCSAGAYLALFAHDGQLQVTFILIAITVWAAMRLPTAVVVVHDLAVAMTVVLFTLAGHGPFADDIHPVTSALYAQLFAAVVAVVGLSLALTRDERDAALAETRRQAALMNAVVDSMADGLAVIDQAGH